MSNRTLLQRALIFLVVFTAFYGLFRLVKQDEWRWDHLAESYAGMLIAFFMVWLFRREGKVDA